MRVLLINPPLADPAGPYPAICYLAGFLETIGIQAQLADANLSLLLRVFSRDGLERLRQEIVGRDGEILVRNRLATAAPQGSAARFLDRFEHYAETIETAVAALQGHDEGAIVRAARPGYFPPSHWTTAVALDLHSAGMDVGKTSATPRLVNAESILRRVFGTLGEVEVSRFRASAMLRMRGHGGVSGRGPAARG